jgi:hypothetical protein
VTGSCASIAQAAVTQAASLKGWGASMSLKYDLEIDVSGSDQHDRTSFIAFLSKLLAQTDEKVIIQHADPEIDDKLAMNADELRQRLSGKTIFVREIMHD